MTTTPHTTPRANPQPAGEPGAPGPGATSRRQAPTADTAQVGVSSRARRGAAPWSRGLPIAGAIIALWAVTLVLALRLPVPGGLAAGSGAGGAWLAGAWLEGAVIVGVVLLRTFLSTGLFITAHDAMHGVVAPGKPRVNAWVGQLALGLYALFPFGRLREAHHEHHRYAGTARDPDFRHEDAPAGGLGVLRWYGRFVWQYLSWWQVVGMAAIFNVLVHVAGVPEGRLLLFWVLPSLLSTVQLFVFGTWLPHRDDHGSFADGHRARTLAFPTWLSLLTCYHFGYHWEHHAWPHVPWWRLPAARRERVGVGQDEAGC